jgi:hypothetical protein
MFDEIFKRWITTGQLTENDIIPLFLEWDNEFKDGTTTPEMILTLVSTLRTNYYIIMCYILKMIGIRRGYRWEEVRDINGKIIYRFFV